MRKWLGRLRDVIRPGRMDRDLERELRFHVNERIDELQDAGMNAETAARPPGAGTVQQLHRTQRKNERYGYRRRIGCDTAECKGVVARVDEVAGVLDHGGADTGTGDRGQQRRLPGDQFGAAAAAALSEQRP